MKFIISLLILGSFSASSDKIVEQQNDNINSQTPIVKESLFLTMERTLCFGKCPSYVITLFNTGRVLYEGRDFAELQGKHKAQLKPEEVKIIEDKLIEIGLFELKDKYDAKITDIPSCILYINYQGKKKKIYNRYGAPDKLKQFEKLVDKIVLNAKFTKLEETD